MLKFIVDKFAEETKQDFISYYESSGLKASGIWGRELESQVTISDFSVNIKYLAPAYTEQLINGRNPNKKQSKEDLKAWVGWAGSTFLKEWVNQKGLNINPFAIAWKIAREGWKVPNQYNKGDLVSSVLNIQKINNLADLIGRSIVDDVKLTIIGNGN